MTMTTPTPEPSPGSRIVDDEVEARLNEKIQDLRLLVELQRNTLWGGLVAVAVILGIIVWGQGLQWKPSVPSYRTYLQSMVVPLIFGLGCFAGSRIRR